MLRATQLIGCHLLCCLCLGAPSLPGQVEVKVSYPEGALILDLDARGAIRVPGRKDALQNSEEVKKYLATEFAAATKKARSGKGKDARPFAMVRVREEVPAVSVEKLRKVARSVGYRTGLDLVVAKTSATEMTAGNAPAGTVVVTVLAEGQFEVLGRKGTVSSVDDLLKALKEEQPAAVKAARKARGAKAKPSIQVRLSKDAGGTQQALTVMVKLAQLDGYGMTSLSATRVETRTVEKKFELDK